MGINKLRSETGIACKFFVYTIVTKIFSIIHYCFVFLTFSCVSCCAACCLQYFVKHSIKSCRLQVSVVLMLYYGFWKQCFNVLPVQWMLMSIISMFYRILHSNMKPLIHKSSKSFNCKIIHYCVKQMMMSYHRIMLLNKYIIKLMWIFNQQLLTFARI